MPKKPLNFSTVILFAFILIGCAGYSNADNIRSFKQERVDAIDHQAVVQKDISYVSDAQELQKLDVYSPSKSGSRPVLIYVHGGAWRMGDKKSGARHAGYYLKNDVVFVSINYRMLPDFKHPAYVQDVASSVKWVVDNIDTYGGDPDKIAISGHSAGAHLVALLGSAPKYLAAHGLDLKVLKFVVGVDTASYDFTLPQDQGVFLRRVISKAFGRGSAQLSDASPRQYILNAKRSDYPDFRLFVTDQREDAVDQTQEFYDALKSSGADVQQYVVKGASHKEMNEQMSDPRSIVGQEILKSVLSLR